MVALALVFLVIAALITIAIIPASSGESVDLELFGAHLTASAASLYVTGLVAGIIAVLSARLLRFGVVREWRQRKRIKDLERRAKAAGKPAAALPEQRMGDEPAEAAGEAEERPSAFPQDADAIPDGWSVPGDEDGSHGVTSGQNEAARHDTP